MKTGSRTKGPARTSNQAIEVQRLDDGTLGVWTTDSDPWLAEERAADDVELAEVVQEFRARGHAKPVRLVFCYDGPFARKGAPPLPMPPSAVPLNLRNECLLGFVLSIADARKVLEPLFGSRTSLLFSRPTWPVSFWEVHITSSQTRVYESRTWRDVQEARDAS
jgi:hypothetical protein